MPKWAHIIFKEVNEMTETKDPRAGTPPPLHEGMRDTCVKCGRSKFKSEGSLCFWCRKEASVAKVSLENFCINTISVRYHPGIARLMAKEFGLDWNRIQEGWVNIELSERRK